MRQEREIKNLIALVLMRYKCVLVFMVIGALVFGVYQWTNQVKESQKPENSQEVINAEYDAAMGEYYSTIAEIDKDIELKNTALALEEQYCNSSFIMKLDSNSIILTEYLLAIDLSLDEDYKQTFEYDATPVSYMTGKIQTLYTSLWNGKDLTTLDYLGAYQSEDKYIREIVSVSAVDGGLIKIQAYSNSTEESQSIANVILSFLNAQTEVVGQISYEHTLIVVSEVTRGITVPFFEETQTNHRYTLSVLQSEIQAKQLEKDALEVPVIRQGYARSEIIRQTLTFAMIGVLIGCLAAVFCLISGCIMSVTLISSKELENACGIRFLGLYGKREIGVSRLARRLSEGKYWEEDEKDGKYVLERIMAQAKGKDILFTSTTALNQQTQSLVQNMKDQLAIAGYKSEVLINGLRDVERIQALKKKSSVVLIEKAAASRIELIDRMIKECEELGSNVEGFVILK